MTSYLSAFVESGLAVLLIFGVVERVMLLYRPCLPFFSTRFTAVSASVAESTAFFKFSLFTSFIVLNAYYALTNQKVHKNRRIIFHAHLMTRRYSSF